MQVSDSIPTANVVAPLLREKLVRFYHVHNPSNVSKVDTILEAYDYNEADLLTDLQAQYGAEALQLFLGEAPVAQRTNSPDPNQPAVGGSEWKTISVTVPAVPPDNQQDAVVGTMAARSASAVDPVRQRLSISSLHGAPTLNRLESAAQGWEAASPLYELPGDVHGSPLVRGREVWGRVGSAMDIDRTDTHAVGAPSHANPSMVSYADALQGSMVADAAFSPTRRRNASRFGSLFVTAPRDDANVASDEPRDAMEPWDAAARVAAATAAVYRRDSKAVSEVMARRMMRAAKEGSAVGPVAHRAADVATDARYRGFESRTIDTLQRSGHPSDSAGATRRVEEYWPRTPAAVQRSINVDETGTYTALLRTMGASGRTHTPHEAPEERPMLWSSGTPVGGLYGRGPTASRTSPSSSMIPVARDLATSAPLIQPSPLVSMMRARKGSTYEITKRSEVARLPLNGAPCVAESEAPIPMICVRCGYIANIVPGREALHDHHHH